MYLHIGEDYIVLFKDIISILDFEKATLSKDSRNFLKEHEKNGQIVTIGDDIPKSFILISGKVGTQIYLSPISSSTLLKRFNIINNRISRRHSLEY